MADTAKEIDGIIVQMIRSVNAIRAVEIGIQRIALNATIRASHLGATGDALNVIAEEMQRLAVNSNAQTETAAASLDSMREASSRVSGEIGGERGVDDADDDVAITSMQQQSLGINSMGRTSSSRASTIAEASAGFAAEITGSAVHSPPI